MRTRKTALPRERANSSHPPHPAKRKARDSFLKRARGHARTLRFASWLGWQMESNWTDPYLFAIYSVVRPIAATLILVFMYFVVMTAGGKRDPELFTFMFLGNAFYMYIMEVLFGVTWVIHEDREHYRMLKYVYISPANIYTYLFGRGVSKIFITTLAVTITIVFGVLFLGVNINMSMVDFPLLLFFMLVGLLSVVGFGIILAGISLLLARHAQNISEGVAGIFYLFCGVLFPISVFPPWAQEIGRALPFTYWFEGLRRAFGLIPGGGMELISTTQITLILLLTTGIFLLFSHLVFKLGDWNARRKGLIDMTTEY